MSQLDAQRKAVLAAKLRNHHIRLLCGLLRQTSEFDRTVLETLPECTPAVQKTIHDICDQATNSLIDEVAAYTLANGATPFVLPKPNALSTSTH